MKFVLKIGSSSLTNQTKALSRPHMAEFARQISKLHAEGHEIVLVCSGSIVAGKEAFDPKNDSVPTKQMLASIGQVRLMHLWTTLFQIYGVTIGQVLLSRSDFSHPSMSQNAENTLSEMLSHHILPIVNENDTVATDEFVPFGENDALAALVAKLIDAKLLLMLTDQQGLYTHDPRTHPEATKIECIERVDDALSLFSVGAKGTFGSGGMATKIEAARSATEHGIEVVIAHAYEPDIIARIVSGDKLGTHFLSQKSPRRYRQNHKTC